MNSARHPAGINPVTAKAIHAPSGTAHARVMAKPTTKQDTRPSHQNGFCNVYDLNTLMATAAEFGSLRKMARYKHAIVLNENSQTASKVPFAIHIGTPVLTAMIFPYPVHNKLLH
jgi:hypothetical protein